MPDPNYTILYVKSIQNSTDFYTKLLKKAPLQASPTFSLFALDSGLMLGLWSNQAVTPATTAIAGSGEIAFSVTNKQIVSEMFAEWVQQGLTIAQEPTDMDFGHTFLALDSDGHRLRVFAPIAP
ncbi:MAG: VOC family protein [Pseudomonadota bacterium]